MCESCDSRQKFLQLAVSAINPGTTTAAMVPNGTGRLMHGLGVFDILSSALTGLPHLHIKSRTQLDDQAFRIPPQSGGLDDCICHVAKLREDFWGYQTHIDKVAVSRHSHSKRFSSVYYSA